MAKWCTVTVIDSQGHRRSLQVLADSSYDAAHLFLHAAKSDRSSALPIPNQDTVFEVAADGKVYKVLGAKLRQWISKQRQLRNGPYGYLFSKREVMD